MNLQQKVRIVLDKNYNYQEFAEKCECIRRWGCDKYTQDEITMAIRVRNEELEIQNKQQ